MSDWSSDVALPISKIISKIAVGYTLDEIENTVTGTTYACFEPALDLSEVLELQHLFNPMLYPVPWTMLLASIEGSQSLLRKQSVPLS